jgi:hypothetical protein
MESSRMGNAYFAATIQGRRLAHSVRVVRAHNELTTCALPESRSA